MRSLNKRWLVVIGLALVLLLIFFLVHTRSTENAKSVNLDSGQHYDKYSGETTSDPKGKGLDKYGTQKDAVLLGNSKLLEIGITSDQLNLISDALVDFASKQKPQIAEISINISTIKAVQTASGDSNILTFQIVADQKTFYSVRCMYSGLDDMDMVILDKNNKEVYSPGQLSSNSGE